MFERAMQLRVKRVAGIVGPLNANASILERRHVQIVFGSRPTQIMGAPHLPAYLDQPFCPRACCLQVLRHDKSRLEAEYACYFLHQK